MDRRIGVQSILHLNVREDLEPKPGTLGVQR